MYARVVRFTDADRSRIEARGEDEQGPPEGINPKQVQVVFDESQQTAVVILFFETEEEMRSADEALNAMDSGDTPGTRASIDQGEIVRTIEPD
jgi:hypothetical protein